MKLGTKISNPAAGAVLAVLAVFTAAFAFFNFKTEDPLLFLATKARMSVIALYLNKDASRAVKIGDYYFNGVAYNLDTAKKSYETALAINPNEPWAHFQTARIFFLQGRFYQALNHINLELKVNPSNLRSLYVRGLINGYAGNLSQAEEDFKGFSEWAPHRWAGYNDLAWIQAKRGRFREMKETVSTAFEKAPVKEINPWLWTSLGIAHLNLKEYNEARNAFLKSLELAEKITPKEFWEAYPGNDPRGAQEAYSRFISTLHFNLGVVYEKLGERENAVKEYGEYLALLPADSGFERESAEKKIKTLRGP